MNSKGETPDYEVKINIRQIIINEYYRWNGSPNVVIRGNYSNTKCSCVRGRNDTIKAIMFDIDVKAIQWRYTVVYLIFNLQNSYANQSIKGSYALQRVQAQPVVYPFGVWSQELSTKSKIKFNIQLVNKK